jgi:hypothetical protein
VLLKIAGFGTNPAVRGFAVCGPRAAGEQSERSAMPILLKHGLLALGSVLWLVGLTDQFHSLGMTAMYVGISALMVVAVVL